MDPSAVPTPASRISRLRGLAMRGPSIYITIAVERVDLSVRCGAR